MAPTRNIMAASVPRMARTTRNPQHPFSVHHKPWQITPFFIAPVLPGETLKNLMWSARVITDPILNPITGWWCEYYYFYVKHRDLVDISEDLQAMMLDPEWDDDPVDASVAVPLHYFHGAGIDWWDHILKRLCAGDANVTYFRNTGEAWDAATLDGLPLARVSGDNVWDSLMPAADVTSADVDVDINADMTITASEVDEALRTWQMLHSQGLTDMTYEDYLATFGTRLKRSEEHVPELVRFVRRWAYPSNTIDPATGAPSSAVSWSVQERADKDRFFKEPGFLVGVTVVRPKVYLANQAGTTTAAMNSLFAWLPAVLMGDANASMVHQPDTTGILGNVADANGYWFDVKDLFLYGEQFVNHALTSDKANVVSLPAADLARVYPAAGDPAALFVDDDPGTAILVRQDGLVSLSIAGRQADTSPTRVVTA